jgi:hypothetical protein
MDTPSLPECPIDVHTKDDKESEMAPKQKIVDKAIDLEHFQQQISTLPTNKAIQVPAGLLMALLTSVVDLKKSVIGLQNETTTLQYDLESLQSYNKMTFTRFPRLPLEIRI